MDAHKKAVAQKCLEGAESGTMTFPQIVMTLMENGFEGYFTDLRRAVKTFYLPTGESIELPMTTATTPVAASFDAAIVKDAFGKLRRRLPATPTRVFVPRSRTRDALVTLSRFPAVALFISAALPKSMSSIFLRPNNQFRGPSTATGYKCHFYNATISESC
jgi:hypothetical protein